MYSEITPTDRNSQGCGAKKEVWERRSYAFPPLI